MEEIKLSENINNSGLTYSQSTYNEYYKTGKKDLFEEVIDSLMLNKYSDDKELVDYIKNLPNDKKRIAILSLLDGDNNLWSKINDRIKIGSKMDYIKDVVLMLREFVKVGEVEKKKYGEVMTPLDLVKDMLNTLPEDVWSNPNLKWLDPANGTGPFPIMVIYKLMNGLKYWEPDEEKRYKHIVENMIYTCELQDKNVFLWLCAVDPKDEYTTNTYWGSFLEEGFDKHMKEVWNVEKFDIVIGNPPYQIDGATGDNKLYLKFISKILNNDNRYLLFVTPKKVIENFTSPKNRDYITKKINFIKLSIDTPSLYFNNIGSSFCYFLIENNNKINDNTEIEYLLNKKINSVKYNVYNFKKIPSVLDPVTLSILNKTVFDKKNNFNLSVMTKENGKQLRIRKKQIDRKVVSNSEDEIYKYKLIDKLKSKGITRYFFTEKLNGHDRPKVLLSKGGSYTFPIFDIFGEMSASDNLLVYYTKNKMEGENFVFICNSKLIKYIEKVITKGSDMDYSWTMLNLPIIEDIDTKLYSDEKLYEYFNLTEEEINLIESSIK